MRNRKYSGNALKNMWCRRTVVGKNEGLYRDVSVCVRVEDEFRDE